MNNTLRRACTGVYIGNITEKAFTLCVNTTVPPLRQFNMQKVVFLTYLNELV